ncbi:MAG TPA: DUF493 family protein [Paenalcaligenes sp.]|nr:DUF493 family protein [Paenalcaligenes sp.]
MSTDDTHSDSDGQTGRETIIEFPCRFPIKVMGRAATDFAQTMTDLVQEYDPDLDPAEVEMRPSRAGNYVGLTLHVNATSQEQLDNIYRALTAHPMVSYVL